MEQRVENNSYFIDMPQGDEAYTSLSDNDELSDSDELQNDDMISASTQALISRSSLSYPSYSSSRVVSYTSSDINERFRGRNPLNSGLWIFIEFLVNVSQIIAAVMVLSSSSHEHPERPLFAWVIGYTAGCTATLPHLYWRYIYRNNQSYEQDLQHPSQRVAEAILYEPTPHSTSSIRQAFTEYSRSRSAAFLRSTRNSIIVASRFSVLLHYSKTALDCFFAVWFVVGNVWIFGGNSFESDAPNLYRLCIVFLTLSFIGYAMPFVLCTTICCCLPCVISVLGLREELVTSRGASTETINALPTYRFKLKRSQSRGDINISSDHSSETGILASGTVKERTIASEDAGCSICLASYTNNDELRELPCSHYFHMECVDKWLKIKSLCPLCKSDIGQQGVSSSILAYFIGSHGSRRLANGANTRVAL